MDPDACLAEMVSIAATILDDNFDETVDDGARRYLKLDAGDQLADHVIALNDWIHGGGALPAQWTPFDGTR